MSTLPEPPYAEIEGDALAIIAAATADDEDAIRVIARTIEPQVSQAWYVPCLIAAFLNQIFGLLDEQGADPAEWIAAKQAEWRMRLAEGD